MDSSTQRLAERSLVCVPEFVYALEGLGPLGRARAQFARTSFGALPSGNWAPTYIYSHTLAETSPFQNDGLLGLARSNDRDQAAPSPGLPVASGQIVVPVDYNHVGAWLTKLMGAAVDTGSGDPYTHVFTSGAEVLPISAMEIAVKNVGGATKYMQYMGIIANKGTIEISRAAGYQKMTIDAMFRSEGTSASSAGGTPAAAWAREPVAATLGVMNIGGSLAANILKMNLTMDNKVTAQAFLNGTAYPSGFDLDDEMAVTGTIDVRFLTSTMYDHAVNGDILDLTMAFNVGQTHSLAFDMATCRLERTGVPITGPGGIQQTFNFRAEQTNSAAQLVATLKSLVASY